MTMLFDLAAEDIKIAVPSGQLGGKKLVPFLKKISAFEKDMVWFEKKRRDPQVIGQLLALAVNEDNFKTREGVTELLARIKEQTPDIIHEDITFDEEHETFEVEVKRQNYRCKLSTSMILSPEFKDLAGYYRELVQTFGLPPYKLEMKTETKEIPSLQELLAAVTENSKKGLSIQRYKGLGEMNPHQLWETTMDPEKRTFLQVTVEDSVKANEMFTILMGDQVEPRKDFITRHALEARNIDI
jgi:DNA gyrase subunit B